MIRKQGMMTWKVMAGAMMIGSAVGAAPAAVTWTGLGGAGNALWSVAGNWDTGVPTSADDVLIGTGFTSGNTLTVGGTLASPREVNNLTIQSGSTALNLGASNGEGYLRLNGGNLTRAAGDTQLDYVKTNLIQPVDGIWTLNTSTRFTGSVVAQGAGTRSVTVNGTAGNVTFEGNNSAYNGNWKFEPASGTGDRNYILWNANGLGTGDITFHPQTASQIFNPNVNATLSNNIIFQSGAGNVFIWPASGLTTTFNGVISGSLTGTNLFFNFQGGVASNATIILGGTSPNTFTAGGTALSDGTLRLDKVGALGGITSIQLGRNTAGASPAINWNIGDTFAGNILVRASNTVGTNTIGQLTAAEVILTGNMTLQTSATVNDGKNLTLNAAVTGATITLTGKITDANSTVPNNNLRGLILTGPGKVKITGNTNDYRGATLVNAGTLLVNNTTGSATGTGAVSVANGATLGGSGFISGPVTFVDNATLAPGNSPGTLTVGGLTLANASVLDFELDALDHTVGGGVNDLVQVNGNLTLDGILNISVLNGASLSNGIYRLFNYTGTVTDNGVAAGTGFPPFSSVQVDTNNKQVNLVVIPEPATLGLLALGGLMIATRRSK